MSDHTDSAVLCLVALAARCGVFGYKAFLVLVPILGAVGEADTSAMHVFISYVREESRSVDRLQGALEAGVRVWRDTADMWPGEDWRARIRQAITGHALVFVACFSGNSLACERSCHYAELDLAIGELRSRRPDVSWLIPVLFDDCGISDHDIGSGRTLASLQRADQFGERLAEEASWLVMAVRQILGQRHNTISAIALPSGDGLRIWADAAEWSAWRPWPRCLPTTMYWTTPVRRRQSVPRVLA